MAELREHAWPSTECAAEGCKRISYTKHGFCRLCREKQPDFLPSPEPLPNCIVCAKPLDKRGKFCSNACAGRMSNAKHNYRLTEAQVLALWAKPACDACGEPFAPGELRHFDHCHTSGHVRGALHGRCNQGIGFAGEDIDLLERWGEYLAADQLDLRALCLT